MPAWLDEIVTEDRLLHCGHAACAGCAPAINVRHVLDGLAAAKSIERFETRFLEQSHQLRLAQRFVKIIDPVKIDPVFTKQRSQISARRSGRFFVDCYFHAHIIMQKHDR